MATPSPAADERLYGHVVVGGEGDLRAEAGQRALRDQVHAAPVAAHDPPASRVPGQVSALLLPRAVHRWQARGGGPDTVALTVALPVSVVPVGGRGAGAGHEVNGLVQHETSPHPVLLRALGDGPLHVPENQGDVDVAPPQHSAPPAAPLRSAARPCPGTPPAASRPPPGRSCRAPRERLALHTSLVSPACAASSFSAASSRPSTSVARSASRRPASVRRTPASCPLDQPDTGLGLQAGQVVADRRLRVVQFPGGGGHRSCAWPPRPGRAAW